MLNDRAAGSGRTALVTGGTGGIGRAVALALAALGDRVVFIGRNEVRGREVLAALSASARRLEHAFLRADLSRLGDAAAVAQEVTRRAPRLDAAVCCAGVLSLAPEWTDEGLERTLALNYLGRYLLARLTLPALRRSESGRLVLVASAGRYADTLDLEDLHLRGGQRGLRVSGRTQAANDLLALELATRMRGTGVEVTCVYPGVTRTDVFRNARGAPLPARLLARAVSALTGRSAERAARTPVFLAHSPEAVGTGGRFFGPDRREIPVPQRLQDLERRRAVWNASESLVAPWLAQHS
jgi:NAD(P)-dependent dehydrogenase (short-subunit alcohol dehydrogenase family)